MNVASVGLMLAERDRISLWASRSEKWACLVIDAESAYGEIRLDPVHVTALGAQLPAVLAGLDQKAAEDAGCEQANLVTERAIDTAAQAVDLAAVADRIGAHELAASLRGAAEAATASAHSVDAHVRAFENATADADHAVEKLLFLMREADAALRARGAEPAIGLAG